ncbi:acetoacetate decarboxylase family protein [Agromyces sp. MMS24-K17]|uniref:acetoacetate decarboxylase family protein n=1 Tax=Agromyces sp. MMS24-K17 TaxID=3372850 RepID=UPI003754E4D8
MDATEGEPRTSIWPRDDDGVAYPPEPWYLGGDFVVAVRLVPIDRLPGAVADAAPAGARLLRLGGRAIVGTALVHYEAGGVLAYEELLVALPAWHRGRLRVVIPQIWVTSPASRAGGRALWGIPKGLAEVRRSHPESGRLLAEVTIGPVAPAAAARGDGHEARVDAAVDAVVGGRLWPWRVRLPLPTAQRLDDRETVSVNVIDAEVRAVRANWRFDADGPLGWLGASDRPLVQLVLARASIVFGRRVERRAAGR